MKTDDDDDLLLAPPDRQAQWEDMSQMLTAIGIAARHHENPKQSPPQETRTPLTILSGFLGAGKTTLLNELLSGDHGRKLAVVVNDFGAVNIDASLIRSKEAGVIGLSNGCVCCSSSGQLGDTLEKLIARDPPPDGIVLESSGVADPLNTAHIILMNQNIRLDAVVTLVDSETVLERLKDATFGDLVKRQLEAADLLVLNKADLVSEEQMSAVSEWVGEHVANASRIQAEHGRVPAEVLLGAGVSHLATEDADHPTQAHLSFETWSFSTTKPLGRVAITDLLSRLPESIVRAKGILQLADDIEYQTIFQAVGKRWQFERGERWGSAAPGSQVVLIASRGGFDPEALQGLFDECVGT